MVARWRDDVDYTAAGIYCFQPYCVTGELDPPANPLIQPQFCLRFNDLDNIGLTGRHYSGFIMLGIQVFNKPDNFVFFKEECVEFNLRWLTEELEIDPDDITLIEDVWAGGGNLGPSIEYFINGLELGNMVFMQYKTFPDGRREPLDVQVIDVGIGLERVPWLINGTATSYCDVFPLSLDFFLTKIGMEINSEIWEKYGPYSCLLNVDEVEDMGKTWSWIADKIGLPVEQVRLAIEPIRDVYIVLDHTRSILMAIEDGSLPSNIGGAANIRNILRRVFHVLHRNNWWKKIEMEGLLEIFRMHKEDLAAVYGPFPDYKSFDSIIRIEYDRWLNTDDATKTKLMKLLSKKNGRLSLDDWILAVTSWGLPADKISDFSGLPVPDNLYYEISQQQEKSAKPMPTVLYNTSSIPPTDSLYFAQHLLFEFDGTILQVLNNVEKNNEPSLVVLDRSAFYPTSGGQEHDSGFLKINEVVYEVVDVLKVGPCVLHVVSPPLPLDIKSYIGQVVHGSVDPLRRAQLRNHHTATHIVYASCRKELGPHVWQQGAKKTTEKAHLDITHYKSLTHEQVKAIEKTANEIVHSGHNINKGFMAKDEAEKKFGFHLYQGGVVPGNELRVVNIEDTDTEACCGTHCDNTAEVGLIRILKASRISDGIVRLYFVAGERALAKITEESEILHTLCESWDVAQIDLLTVANRFFDGYRRFGAQIDKKNIQIFELQLKAFNMMPDKGAIAKSDQENPTQYITLLPSYASTLRSAKKNFVVVGDSFLVALIGDTTFDVEKLRIFLLQLEEDALKKEEEKAAPDLNKKPRKKLELQVKNSVQVKNGKVKEVIDNIYYLLSITNPNAKLVHSYFVEQLKFTPLD